MSDKRYYLQLHFIILLNSFLPTMISWIERLNSVEIVLIRAYMALIILYFVLRTKKISIKIGKKEAREIILSGTLMATYWMLLVFSTITANASVTLVGVATSPLWVTFITPFFTGKKVDFYQMMTGLNAVFGIYMISSNNFQYESGMVVAILAAFAGALLTVVSSKYARKHNHFVVTFYQMIGACISTTVFLPIYALISDKGINFDPAMTDIIVVFMMAFLFSVYAYSLFIKVMKKLTPFTVALTTNLSPIYGILIALMFSLKDERMNIYFYSGAIIIIASVMAFPLVQYFFEGNLSFGPSDSPKPPKPIKRENVEE